MTLEPLSRIELEVIERLEAKTVITEQGCWKWHGSTVEDGYGVISYQGQQHRIHRLIYSIYKGALIPGMLICHTCDNPPCWNIDHIWQGTYSDNTQDMWAKNRQGKFKRGRKHGESSKLFVNDIHEIRKLLDVKIPNTEIAKRFGVSGVMISRIKLRKAWAWL